MAHRIQTKNLHGILAALGKSKGSYVRKNVFVLVIGKKEMTGIRITESLKETKIFIHHRLTPQALTLMHF